MMPFAGGSPGPDVRLTRWFPATPERVFRAFTDPADLAEWWRPRGFVLDELVFAAAPGASYRVSLRAPDGTRFTHVGVFLEVTPPASLVYTWRWIEGPLDGSETLVELGFAGDRGGTTVSLRHSRFVDERERDRHTGWTDAFEALLARLQPAGTNASW